MSDTTMTGQINVSSRRAIFGSIAVSIAFVMELTLVPLLLPAIQSEFGLSIGELAWFFNSYGVAVALGVLLGGWLGDNFHTKKVFALGVLCFAIGSAAVALIKDYEFMILARILQGFGGGIFSPLVPILLTRASPVRPGKVLILWGSVAGFVAALAPLLYGGLLAGFGWQFGFMIFAIVSVAALFVMQLSHTPDEPMPAVSRRRDYGRMVRSSELWALYGYVFCTYGAISFYLFSIPLRLVDIDFEVVSIGLTLSIMWLSFSIASTLLRNVVDRPFVRVILLAAPILSVAGFGLVYASESLVCLTISAMLVGTALACSNAPSTLLILRLAPKGTRALSASLDISFARLGGVMTIFALAHAMFGLAVLGIALLSIVAVLFGLQATRNLDQGAEEDQVEGGSAA